MNIIRMSGGIGNQMFQYALYLKLVSLGKEVKFDDVTEYELDNARPIMLSVFGIDYPKASREELVELTDASMDFLSRVRRKIFGRKKLMKGRAGNITKLLRTMTKRCWKKNMLIYADAFRANGILKTLNMK